MRARLIPDTLLSTMITVYCRNTWTILDVFPL